MRPSRRTRAGMRLWRWLYPGLGVKRWLLVFSLGLFVAGWGMAGWFGARPVSWVAARLGELLPALRSPGLVGSIVLAAAGLGLVFLSLGRIVRSVAVALVPNGYRSWPDMVFRHRRLEKGPRVVAIGGGTGLSTLLRGMKRYTRNITAVVTVADDGGSSGVLRGEMGILPPGDIRNCLVALADTEPLMARLFQHRFRRGPAAGHSFGNLFIGAMCELSGDVQEAIRMFSQVLAVRGSVVPATLSRVTLRAVLEDGREVDGESLIPRAGGRIRSVELVSDDGADPQPVPGALDAIAAADIIIVGPGSLYTSIVPNLLVEGLTDALIASPALKVYVCNLMTQRGETDGLKASDHARVLLETAPGLFKHVLVNTGSVLGRHLTRYLDQGAVPVQADVHALRVMGLRPVSGDFVDSRSWVRHRPEALAHAIITLYLAERVETDPRSVVEFYWQELWPDEPE